VKDFYQTLMRTLTSNDPHSALAIRPTVATALFRCMIIHIYAKLIMHARRLTTEDGDVLIVAACTWLRPSGVLAIEERRFFTSASEIVQPHWTAALSEVSTPDGIAMAAMQTFSQLHRH
jgi:hypothetical protein